MKREEPIPCEVAKPCSDGCICGPAIGAGPAIDADEISKSVNVPPLSVNDVVGAAEAADAILVVVAIGVAVAEA